MSTFTQILYQIVYSTKYREKTLEAENRKELYKYIWGILNNNKCYLYQIGGIEDHIHIITHLHPSVALATNNPESPPDRTGRDLILITLFEMQGNCIPEYDNHEVVE